MKKEIEIFLLDLEEKAMSDTHVRAEEIQQGIARSSDSLSFVHVNMILIQPLLTSMPLLYLFWVSCEMLASTNLHVLCRGQPGTLCKKDCLSEKNIKPSCTMRPPNLFRV